MYISRALGGTFCRLRPESHILPADDNLPGADCVPNCLNSLRACPSGSIFDLTELLWNLCSVLYRPNAISNRRATSDVRTLSRICFLFVASVDRPRPTRRSLLNNR